MILQNKVLVNKSVCFPSTLATMGTESKSKESEWYFFHLHPLIKINGSIALYIVFTVYEEPDDPSPWV
jgi:hypothetical protein